MTNADTQDQCLISLHQWCHMKSMTSCDVTTNDVTCRQWHHLMSQPMMSHAGNDIMWCHNQWCHMKSMTSCDVMTTTTTVSQHLKVLRRTLLFSTIMTHCGIDKIALDLNVHAVILQTSHGFARTFLSQLLMTWSFVSVGMSLAPMKMFPLTLLNSTYSEPCVMLRTW